jgi:Protein of unknown function (DUF3768)
VLSVCVLSEQNDAFRAALKAYLLYGGPKPRGALVLSLRVELLVAARRGAMAEICDLVLNCNEFLPWNRHEALAFQLRSGERLWWRISYRNSRAPEHKSTDPTDPGKTYRVLTISLADEPLNWRSGENWRPLWLLDRETPSTTYF